MKKLMFAAAVAACVTGAYAGCGLEGDPDAGCIVPVWDFQMVLRADSGCYCYDATQAAKDKTICGLGGQAGAAVCVNWRVLETRAFSAVIFACDCVTCDEWQKGLEFAMYDVGRGVRYYTGLENESPKLEFIADDFYRFGFRGENVAALADLEFKDAAHGGEKAALQLAGHGAFYNELIPASLAGFVTGTIGDTYTCDRTKIDEDGKYTVACNYYDLCQPTALVNLDLEALMKAAVEKPAFRAVAYGQWVMQFNLVKAANFSKSGVLDKDTGKITYDKRAVLPDWFLSGIKVNK